MIEEIKNFASSIGYTVITHKYFDGVVYEIVDPIGRSVGDYASIDNVMWFLDQVSA